MATSHKLNKLLETKAAIRNAIIDKGVDVGEDTVFADYPAKISAIESGISGPDYTAVYLTKTSNGTTYKDLFKNNTILTEINLNGYDSSNVTNMSSMFNGCEALITIKSLNSLNTDNVTDMNYMFFGCKTLTELDVNNFNTSNVTNMSSMFNGCTALTSLDVSGFNTSNVTNTSYMFKSYPLTKLDLSNFNTAQVIDISSMFYYCDAEEIDIRNFDLTNAENVNNMFYSCYNLHTLRLDNCNNDTISKIINSSSFAPASYSSIIRNIYVNPDNISGLTLPNKCKFINCETGEEIAPEIDIPLYVSGEFKNKTGLTEVTTMVNESHTSLSNMFDCCYNLATINGIEQWNTSNVTKMNHMFNYCQKLIELDLSSFNTSKVTSMYAMFMNCSNLEILDIRNFDTTNVTDMQFMFSLCYELQELRLDNCSNETINKIITSGGFPTDAILDVTKKIYVNPNNIGNLEAPKNWVFVNKDTGEVI